MIFVDSNIPMYVIGAPHPNKQIAQRLLEQAVQRGTRLVTDAEVFQELLHRYTAIHRPAAIQPAFDLLLDVVDDVFPVAISDVERAKDVLAEIVGLSARDALHLALMQRHNVNQVMSFDTDFDRVADINRQA